MKQKQTLLADVKAIKQMLTKQSRPIVIHLDEIPFPPLRPLTGCVQYWLKDKKK